MNEQQREAVRLVGHGLGTGEISRRLGVSAKTVQRWKKLPDFQQAIARPVEPSLRAVLEDAAYNACKRDGSPDHTVRIAAARTLLMLGAETPKDDNQRVTVTIFRRGEEQAA